MGVFKDWMEQQLKESTPFTRRRRAAALGLAPTIPSAEINSHSTARPWERDRILKRNREEKKCNC